MSDAPWKRMGTRIRVYREAADLTQGAFAEKVHVTQSAVSLWEQGRRLPSRPSQYAIADALRTTRSILFRELVDAENAA